MKLKVGQRWYYDPDCAGGYRVIISIHSDTVRCGLYDYKGYCMIENLLLSVSSFDTSFQSKQDIVKELIESLNE